MAAKQGTLAQLSAQAEDARRAVLTKAGVSKSSWFSNLNTICTIKSAPPRSPDVLEMLAIKSGYIYKRNEQHMWQARWCCVVPHMFLYYFDIPHPKVPNPTSSQQEAWNEAIQNGLGNRKQHEKRSTFPYFGSPDTGAAESTVGESDETVKATQPTGIIDLECYTSIHRSSQNSQVIELAGDDQVNPDLRAFYFRCESDDEVEEWNTALLNNRHSALFDEVDAYKQVADGFAQQLQTLHIDLDEAKIMQEESENQLYRLRSTAEETRRSVYRMVEDSWEEHPDDKVETKARSNFETVKQQDLGVIASARVLLDYIREIRKEKASLHERVDRLTHEARNTTDQSELDYLRLQHKQSEIKWEEERTLLAQQLAASQAAAREAKTELGDVQKDLSSTKMEVTMLMSQQRTKLAELQQHKKILKKEVVDLRKKLEDSVSEQGILQHECEKLKLVLEQERSQSKLLTRYVDKMENQVQVQQNMMEMMSHAGGSVYGGMSVVRSIGSNNNDYTPNRRNRGQDLEEEVEDDNFESDERLLLQPTHISPRQRMRRSHQRMFSDDMDNKSHVSELTEDRTQREFAAYQNSMLFHQHGNIQSPRQQSRTRTKVTTSSPVGPPSVIIGVKKNEKRQSSDEEGNRSNGMLDTIDNTSVRSMQGSIATSGMRRSAIPRRREADTESENGPKLSVAQRARMEADRTTTPVKARLDEKSLSSLQRRAVSRSSHGNAADSKSPQSTSGSLWKRMENAVLGPSLSDDEESYTSESSEHDGKQASTGHKEEKKSDSSVRLSLTERARLQRERQVRKLKEQGLVAAEDDLKGGAMDSASVASSNMSPRKFFGTPTPDARFRR